MVAEFRLSRCSHVCPDLLDGLTGTMSSTESQSVPTLSCFGLRAV